jgi:hypothetical protein
MENKMNKKLKSLKDTLKKNAHRIKELKALRKSSEFGYVHGLDSAQFDYRVGHIAYSLLRGRTPEQIESNHRPEKEYERKWAWDKATKLKLRIEEEIADEALCPGA